MLVCCPKEITSRYSSPEVNKKNKLQEYRKKLRNGIPPLPPSDLHYTDNLLKEVKKKLEEYRKSPTYNICYNK
tara:strand:- start:1757 stop:1975 length:219 start_codon:yes stop_codon:yes gene_type:complete